MYVTACDLEKSFIFEKTVEITSHVSRKSTFADVMIKSQVSLFLRDSVEYRLHNSNS